MMRVVRFFIFLALLFPSLLYSQTKEENIDFFVKIFSDKEKVVEGDSCLLSVVCYATDPFLLKDKPAHLRVKNASFRQLNLGQQRLQRVMENDQIYYALLVEQYVLFTRKVGRVTVAERSFNVDVHVQETPNDPFDMFFGRRPKVTVVKKKAKNQPFSLEVIEKPRRTLQEMRRSGVNIL